MITEIYSGEGKIKLTVWDGTRWKDKSVDEETRAFQEACKEKWPDKTLPEYIDTYGELFAIRYISQLTKTSSRIDVRKVLDPIEGKDFVGFDILGKNGNAEIKTIKPFLYRNNNSYERPDEGGSIPFEIFHRWIPSDYKKMYAGWVLSAYDSTKYNEIKKNHGRDERAEMPGIYIFILVSTNGKPYACVAFEDIYALLRRLHDLCPEPEKWGIPNPHTLTSAANREYWDKFDAQKNYDENFGGMIQNCWHVPLRSICDLATVTMIKEIDLDKEWGKVPFRCELSVMKSRYATLQKIADRDGRKEHFDPDEWTRRENEKINSFTRNGIKVSKRTLITMSEEELEELKKGIDFTANGDVHTKVWFEPKEGKEEIEEHVKDILSKTSQVDEEH